MELELYGESAITVFRMVPTDSISDWMTSPAARNSAGLRCIPTPLGVPVRITSPGVNVMVLKRFKVQTKA